MQSCACRSGSESGEKAPTSLDQQTGELSRKLASLISVISDQYVREVPTAAIYESAITALYEAARQPLPSELLLDLKKTENPTYQQRIVALARAKLGSMPELEGNRDLTATIKGLPNALDPYCGLVVAHEFQNRGDTMLNFGFDLEGEGSDSNLLRARLPNPREDNPFVPGLPFRVVSVEHRAGRLRRRYASRRFHHSN